MTIDNLLDIVDAKCWSDFSDTDYNNTHIVKYTLQFYNNEWIYGYTIYNRNMNFPMFGVKSDNVCVINNEEELKAFGEMAKRKGTDMFTNKIDVIVEKNENYSKLGERINNDKSIISIDESYDGDRRYVYIIGKKI